MDNRIPVPTDNIFKFYALFGLLLFVFCSGSLIYVNNSANAIVLTNIVELETLKEIEEPTIAENAKLTVLQKQIDLAVSNRKFFEWTIALIWSLSICLAVYGFWKWHTVVQPVLDETAKVQLETYKLQLEKLRVESGRNNGASQLPGRPSE